MKKLTWAVVAAAFAALEAIFKSAISIKDSIGKLGLTRRFYITFAGLLLLAALAFGAWKLWSTPAPAVLAGPAAVLADVPKESIPVAHVKAYKAEAKRKLALPAAVQASSAQVVLAATDLPKSKHERTVSAVLDADTGEVTQYFDEKPLPWVAQSSAGSASIYGGIKGIEPAIRASVTQDFYSIKGVQIGAVVSADYTLSGQTDTFIGVGARYEW